MCLLGDKKLCTKTLAIRKNIVDSRNVVLVKRNVQKMSKGDPVILLKKQLEDKDRDLKDGACK